VKAAWGCQPRRPYHAQTGQEFPSTVRHVPAREIHLFVKDRLAAHEYPREIGFTGSLPMNATGKIMRRELKERESK
jgi:acyl-coenzyme A synthetase/AMP-(fatty) acid ligase